MKLLHEGCHVFPISDLRPILHECKNQNQFFSINFLEEKKGSPPRKPCLDIGRVVPDSSQLGATFDQWCKDFKVNKDIPKPFWFHGKRYTPEEFEGLLILIV